MSAKVTHLFDRRRAGRWRPAPERTSIPLPLVSIEQQLGMLAPPAPPSPDLDHDDPPVAHEVTGEAEDTEVLPAVYMTGPATHRANQRQRLRHANELLSIFTKTA